MNQICRCKPYLGTFVEISMAADCGRDELLNVSQKAFAVVEKIHNDLSFHAPQSELSQINKTAVNGPVNISTMTRRILLLARDIYLKSEGVFDVSVAPLLIRDGYLPQTVPIKQMKADFSAVQIENNTMLYKQPLAIDLGGIAKGFAVDMAMEYIEKKLGNRLKQAVINAGGDMRVFDWRAYEVLIPDTNKNLQAVKMANSSIASSSSYYLNGGSAIYSVRSGQELKLRQTISVFAPECVIADALTKIAVQVPANDPIFDAYNAHVMLS